MLNILDEFTRECLAIRIDRKLNLTALINVLTDLFVLRGVPGQVRSDNGPEFIATAVRDWISAVGAKTAYFKPGRLPANGYCEGVNSKLRDELPNGEIFYSLAVIEAWCVHSREATFVAGLSTNRAGGLPLGVKARRVVSPVGPRLGTTPVMHQD